MANKWQYVSKINFDHKPTPTQQALIDAIKASGKRVFDANSWNIRTIRALLMAGWLYVDCGATYKHVALVIAEPAVVDAKRDTWGNDTIHLNIPGKRLVNGVDCIRVDSTGGVIVIDPIPADVSLDQLEGAFVQAHVFDDPVFKHEKYLGTIQEVKSNWLGEWVRFSAESGPQKIIGSKWIKLEKVIGLASYAGIEKAAS